MWLQIAIVGVVLAVEPMPDRASPSDPIDDVVQTIQARKLLYDDPRLRDLNLGVAVKNRIATLWGPAPSLELSQLAETRLRRLIELRDVRNELHQ